MTKEQFIDKWQNEYDSLGEDLDAVIATEIAKVQEQPAKPFDKERFEAMFRAVLVGDVYENAIKATEEILKQLDAYYATKEGGNNG